MTRPLAVLRPEPGNTATVVRAREAGFATIALPLFAMQGVSWAAPDPTAYDALILTSANALRFGGAGLAGLTTLPVFAVGPHTAAAARAAGFDVMATGAGTGADIAALATARGIGRALHLTGRHHILKTGGPIATIMEVYESVEVAIDRPALRALEGSVSLLHSAGAARRLAALVDDAALDRSHIAVVTFSHAIAAAAGAGWAGLATAATPDDTALFAAVRALPVTTSD